MIDKALHITHKALTHFGLIKRGYVWNPPAGGISSHALDVARQIRGPDRKPVIFIQGVMPRSGTVYAGELLRLHSDLYAYPNDIWELPFLENTGVLLEMQHKFLRSYQYNKGKIEELDFLPLFGASLIAYLYALVPADKQLLLKVPSLRYLDHFDAVFPFEKTLILLRDGRDVVTSFKKTWPRSDFVDVSRRWALNTQMALNYDKQHQNISSPHYMARFEDVVRDPATFVRTICKRFDLDPEHYPYDRIETVGVSGSSALKTSQTVTWDMKKKPTNFNPIGRWKEWPTYQKWRFKRVAGPTLVEAGYSNGADW